MNTYRFSRMFAASFIGVALVLALVLLLSSLPNAQAKSLTYPAGVTRYVSTSGNDTANDCTISGTSCRTVQHAMDVVQDGDEIRVAAGMYTGTMREFLPAWSDYVTATVVITKNIAALLGGYSSDFATRDPDLNETTLSAIASPGDWVIFITGTSTLVDGFTVTGSDGSNTWYGGGIRVNGGTPTISRNRIQGNSAFKWGGGIYVTNDATPTISANLIYSNTAENGGGIYIRSGTPVISGNQIFSNTALNGGGGIFMRDRLTAGVIARNIISGNIADFGGGIRIEGVNVFTITDNLIASNHAISLSDGVVQGGGIAVYNGDWSTPSAGYIYNNQILSNTTAADSNSTSGAGLQLNGNVSTLILSNTFRGNVTPEGGGAIYVTGGATPVIKANLILSNTASYGSGIQTNYYAWPLVDSNLFAFNSGACIALFRATNPITIVNNVIVRSGDEGVYIEDTNSASLVNNTIAFNTAEGIEVSRSTVRVHNNIVVSNTNCGINVLSGGVSTVTLEYNDLWGNMPANYCNQSPGTGDISADPLFVDAANGDYHIRSGSPAMNTGTNVGAPAYDKDGLPRPQGSGVDMGAYEVRVYSIYLPAVLKMQPGIYGRLTYQGLPVSGINIRLWRSGGVAVLTTTTQADGSYLFTGAPSLLSGQQYYVFYANSNVYNNTPNPNYLI